MRIYTTINDRTVRRTFRERRHRHRPLFVLDHTLPDFGLRVDTGDTRIWFLRVVHKLGAVNLMLGKTTELTAAEAREKAIAEIGKAKTERQAGPLMREFVWEFVRRRARLWKPATQRSNLGHINRAILPCFGGMRVAEIARADVQRWFASLSGTPGVANRALPVLSVMMTAAEHWDIRPQGSNPCRNMRRYRMTPRDRFLSAGELKRLGNMLDHAADRQAAAAIRLLLFTGARSSEIVGLRWGWIRDTRAVLPDSKSGPKTVQLPAPARAVLAALPRAGEFVFPNQQGDGPMTDLGARWQKLRNLAGLEDVRIHDCRHTYASHAVMSGLDLYTVGRLLGHRRRETTAIYAHLDDHALQGAAEQAAGRIAGAMGFRTGTPPKTGETKASTAPTAHPCVSPPQGAIRAA